MYFYASLLVAFVITLIVVTKIAEMLLAKRPKIGWVLLASLVGGGAALAAYSLLSIFVKGIDPMIMLIASLTTMFLVSSAAFKYINQMSWSGAITTNVANIVVVLITMTAAVVLNGKSLEEEFLAVNSATKEKISMVEAVATDSEYEVEGAVSETMPLDSDSFAFDSLEDVEANPADDVAEASEFEAEEEQITELDLLPPAAVKAIERKKKVVYKEPKYRLSSVGNVRGLVGQTVRILKSNGNTISGALKKVDGSEVFVEQRIANGTAFAPISISKIRKIEVYR